MRTAWTPGSYILDSDHSEMTWDTTWADLFPEDPPDVLRPFYGPRPVVKRAAKSRNPQPVPSPESLAIRAARDGRVAAKQQARAEAKPSPAAKALASQAKKRIAEAASLRVPDPPAPSAALKAHVPAAELPVTAAATRPRRVKFTGARAD